MYGPPIDVGRPLKLIALAWVQELVKVLESLPPRVSFPALLPEQALCRGPVAFP